MRQRGQIPPDLPHFSRYFDGVRPTLAFSRASIQPVRRQELLMQATHGPLHQSFCENDHVIAGRVYCLSAGIPAEFEPSGLPIGLDETLVRCHEPLSTGWQVPLGP
jgi:hypothetical protein